MTSTAEATAAELRMERQTCGRLFQLRLKGGRGVYQEFSLTWTIRCIVSYRGLVMNFSIIIIIEMIFSLQYI